ncbi:NEU3 isoform 4 [Pan troglodytes]|uniref:Neuraminidase 3 n=6 Tax=Homininae TaxID=207598 RepID=E9PI40_HUMAN|nr:sialidase-3 isoform f [Homo sapiens]KAI2561856.1 neuraminidase 3 [Homo sapiens]KAI4073173.1 neuraminidase 3 [Homo sapiens]PNI56727.1 NEU3 isoform 4 [Pan troglodytes]
MRPADLPPRPMEESPASSSAPTETEEPGSSAAPDLCETFWVAMPESPSILLLSSTRSA